MSAGVQVDVRLDWHELDLATDVGLRRARTSWRAGHRPRYGGGKGVHEHLLGAVCECVVAKAAGLYWPARTDVFYGGDLCDGTEVRGRGLNPGNGLALEELDLILHDADSDDRVYVLVVARDMPAGLFRIAGEIFGRDGKQPAYWREHVPGRPAYFVPQSELEPFGSLVRGGNL